MIKTYKIKKIEFQLTTTCNMKCSFCFNGQNASYSRLPTGIIRRAIDELCMHNKNHDHDLIELESIWITGGEPLLEKSSVIEIIQQCNHLNLNTGLATNGFLLDGSLNELIDAGLSEVRISIDSLCLQLFEKLRGKQGSFEKVMRNIELSVKSGLKTSVRITVTNENIHEIRNIAEIMAKLGVARIELKSVIPVGRADFEMMISPKVLEEVLNEAVNTIQQNEAYQRKVSITVMCNCLPKCEGFVVSPNVACVCGYSALYVAANGSIIPCSYFPKKSAFNIYNNAILEAWQSSLFEDIRNKKPEKCRNCFDWTSCKNGCPAIVCAYKQLGYSCYDIINKKTRNYIANE